MSNWKFLDDEGNDKPKASEAPPKTPPAPAPAPAAPATPPINAVPPQSAPTAPPTTPPVPQAKTPTAPPATPSAPATPVVNRTAAPAAPPTPATPTAPAVSKTPAAPPQAAPQAAPQATSRPAQMPTPPAPTSAVPSQTPVAPRPSVATAPAPAAAKPSVPAAPAAKPTTPAASTPAATKPAIPPAPAAPPAVPAAAPAVPVAAPPAPQRPMPTPPAAVAPQKPVPQAPQPPVPGAPAPLRPTPVAPTPQAAGAPAPQAATPKRLILRDEESWWRPYLDKLDPVAYWLFRVAAGIGVIALAWLLFSIFGGGAGSIAPNDPRAAQIAHDMKFAAQIVNVALIVIAVSLIILMFDASSVGPALAIIGLVLHFGSPFALKSIGQTMATVSVAKVFQGTGFALVFIGFFKYSIDLMRWVVELPNRMKMKADIGVAHQAEPAQQRIAREATMLSPCWKLPYCREVIRKQCPAYLAKKRCWKFGRGCYCDEEMISRIIRGESLEVIKAPTRQSRQGKPPCGRCHIFLEHQGLKYKMMSPLAVPGTLIGMYLLWPFYDMAFSTFSRSLDAVWSRLSFDPSKITPQAIKTDEPINNINQYSLSPKDIEHYAMVMFGVILGFFVLIYISKFIEWAIFKMKW